MADNTIANGISLDNLPDEIIERLAKYDNMLSRQKANQANYRKNLLKKGYKTAQVKINVRYAHIAKLENLVPTVVYAPEHLAKRIQENGARLVQQDGTGMWYIVESRPDEEKTEVVEQPSASQTDLSLPLTPPQTVTRRAGSGPSRKKK
jgi:hypothetical protein